MVNHEGKANRRFQCAAQVRIGGRAKHFWALLCAALAFGLAGTGANRKRTIFFVKHIAFVRRDEPRKCATLQPDILLRLNFVRPKEQPDGGCVNRDRNGEECEFGYGDFG